MRTEEEIRAWMELTPETVEIAVMAAGITYAPPTESWGPRGDEWILDLDMAVGKSKRGVIICGGVADRHFWHREKIPKGSWHADMHVGDSTGLWKHEEMIGGVNDETAITILRRLLSELLTTLATSKGLIYRAYIYNEGTEAEPDYASDSEWCLKKKGAATPVYFSATPSRIMMRPERKELSSDLVRLGWRAVYEGVLNDKDGE